MASASALPQRTSSFGINRRMLAGVLGGIAGGLVFGMLMAMMGTLPAPSSDSATGPSGGSWARS